MEAGQTRVQRGILLVQVKLVAEKVKIVNANDSEVSTMLISGARIALTIKTKLMSAENITSILGVTPYSFANIGEDTRYISPSKIIKTGVQKWSSWTRTYEIEDSKIEEKLIEIIGLCKPHKIIIQRILKNGGLVEAQIRLSGKNNVGDVFSTDTLTKLVGLGMSLSIEVFP